MSSITDLPEEPTLPPQPNEPGIQIQLHTAEDDPLVPGLPHPVHIYTIQPTRLARLFTLDLSVIHQRTTTNDDLRNFIKCFYQTIPRIRLETKLQLLDSFIYYVVPILRSPHIFDKDRGIIYCFDVPFQIELQDAPQAGDPVGNDIHNGEGEGAADAA